MENKDKNKRDVDRCANKILDLLKEYNCVIEFDSDLEICILVDMDNSDYSDNI